MRWSNIKHTVLGIFVHLPSKRSNGSAIIVKYPLHGINAGANVRITGSMCTIQLKEMVSEEKQ
jgi:hypothetical protein